MSTGSTLVMLVDPLKAGDARPSSIEGKVIPFASDLRALAKDEVRRIVFETPEEMVFIVSLRLRVGREPPGEGGGRVNDGDVCIDATRALI